MTSSIGSVEHHLPIIESLNSCINDKDAFSEQITDLFFTNQACTPTKELKLHNFAKINYEEMLYLFDTIENNPTDESYTPDQLQSLKSFLALLAMQGTSQSDLRTQKNLEKEIEQLIHGEVISMNDLLIGNKQPGTQHPVNFKKGWIKRKCQSTGSFIKKHKKEIIIGAAIVAAIVIVVIVTSSTGGAAAGAGATALANAKDSKKENETKAPPELKQAIEDNSVKIANALQDKELETLATQASGHEELAFEEIARNVGSKISHEVLDEVKQYLSPVPQFFEETQELGQKLLPSVFPPDDKNPLTPQKNFEELVASGHKKIDHAFDTENYNPNNKLEDKFATGVLPFPGKITTITANVKRLSAAGQVIDKGKYSKAGRALMKHGYRKNSVYPKPVGTPEQINAQGQEVLNSILNDPKKIIYEREHEQLGRVIEVVSPAGEGKSFATGARFSMNKKMIGFLEP